MYEALENVTVEFPTIDGKTMQQALQYMAAVLCGKVSGVGTGKEVFTGIDGATRRVAVMVGSSGARTAVTYD